MTRSSHRSAATALLVLLWLTGSACPKRSCPEESVRPGQRALWISDDGTHTVYRIFVSDAKVFLESSFKSPAGVSGISLDPHDGTLWGAVESRRFGGGRALNFSRTGRVVRTIEASAIDRGADTLEGIAVDPLDSTLWIVDDSVRKVYHLRTDGQLLSSFPCSAYDVAASSPQAIDVDALNDSLWLTDNATNRVYNVRKTGRLISSFPATDVDPLIENLQGIAVDASDGTLWITARDTGKIYNVTSSGGFLMSFSTDSYDRRSQNPTGIAVDTPAVLSSAEVGD